MRHFAAVFLLLVLTARYGFAEHPNGWSVGIVPIDSSFWIADFFETYVEVMPSFGIGIDFEGKSDNYTLNNGIYHEGGTGLKFGLLAAAGFRFWTESRRNVPVAKTRDTGA
ncbi:MAG: hypothetical protein LBG72_10545, partial [Spirochaetaceae bacterium]|nr:hypothetical protein [Spirochaetaceae bacterium]